MVIVARGKTEEGYAIGYGNILMGYGDIIIGWEVDNGNY